MIRVLFLLTVLFPSALLSQQLDPYSYEDIKAEVGTTAEAALIGKVRQRHVAFAPTDAQIAELKGRGAAEPLIAVIKENPAATLIVNCDPVECDVAVKSGTLELSGRTVRGLTHFTVPPGAYVIEVTAKGYLPQVNGAVLTVGESKREKFAMGTSTSEPTSGTLVVICTAGDDECLVRLDDVAEEKTTQQQVRFTDVGPGRHVVILSADGYLDKSVLISINAGDLKVVGPDSLTPHPGPVLSSEQVFSSILGAIGDESDPKLNKAIQLEATSTLKHKFEGDSAIEVQDKVTYIESVMPGKWIRWDLLVLPNLRMMLARMLTEPPDQLLMEADPQLTRLAIPADLKRTFTALQHVRLIELLRSLKDPAYVKVLGKNGQRLLTATGPDGEFDITYDDQFRPVEIQHHPGGGLPVTEVTYSDYAKVGGWTLPFSMTVSFSDVPSFVQEFHYSKYYLGADLRETDLTKIPYGFKYKGKTGISLWRGGDTKCFSEAGLERGACRLN